MQCLTLAGNLMAQKSTGDHFITNDNVAINGFDVTTYFTHNESMRGNQKFQVTHNGIKYWFVNEENKKKFLEAPDKYLPQFGGWCAFAVGAQNTKVPSDPNTFKLYNGKLYLFFNDYYNGAPFNTIIPWNESEIDLKEKADANWNNMSKK